MEGEDSGPGLEGDPYPLRTVGIHRGERGYGVTVSGESPVIVQDVKDGKNFLILSFMCPSILLFVVFRLSDYI